LTPSYLSPAGVWRLPSGKHTSILTEFQTKDNKKIKKLTTDFTDFTDLLATKRHKKHKHFLDHEEHEERLKNKFIVRRKMATKRHRRISGKQGIRM